MFFCLQHAKVTSLPVGNAGKEGCPLLIFDPKYVDLVHVILLCRIYDILLFWLFRKMRGFASIEYQTNVYGTNVLYLPLRYSILHLKQKAIFV